MKTALIGFGEAGQAFVTNWPTSQRQETAAFDLKTLEDDPVINKKFQTHGINQSASTLEALAGAEIVFSLVTADQAPMAAQHADAIETGALFLDCNSISPGTKKQNEAVIESYGGRYVDVAVMAPVHPALNKVPLLISGAHAQDAIVALGGLGFENTTLVAGENGVAASIKMLRSVMVKGIEALTAECVLAGQRAGVDRAVLNSLNASDKAISWQEKAAYNLERMSEHGLRRAAEMEEVAKTVEELGLAANMTHGTVKWQRQMGELGYEAISEDYATLAEEINKLID